MQPPNTNTPCPDCKYWYEAWRKKCDEQHDYHIRMQQWAVLWQGKHAILRHENNALRRKLHPKK